MTEVAIYTNSISAHQLPLAREIVARVGEENFRYVYTGDKLQRGGQEVASTEKWVVRDESKSKVEVEEWKESCDLLISGIRDVDLFERRTAKGLKTYYQSERWLKPIAINLKLPSFNLQPSTIHLQLPGRLRMLVPSYRRMAKRFVAWLRSDPNSRYLAIGPWAKRDMIWLGVPPEKIVDWGYFVAPAERSEKLDVRSEELKGASEKCLKILWVGRPIWWKRVDTIRKAVARVSNATLDLFTNISLEQVREEMRNHDVYVLASNELEGWGAALNEAMEEGMTCVGTYEAGASAAMLPKENLFHAGDWRTLAKMLERRSFVHVAIPREYTAAGAAEKIVRV